MLEESQKQMNASSSSFPAPRTPTGRVRGLSAYRDSMNHHQLYRGFTIIHAIYLIFVGTLTRGSMPKCTFLLMHSLLKALFARYAGRVRGLIVLAPRVGNCQGTKKKFFSQKMTFDINVVFLGRFRHFWGNMLCLPVFSMERKLGKQWLVQCL